ncbi:recombinase family protein [Streptomyces ficellus]|uniref:recombinase family protein n=1 Tax=Streptomyces ficellus TaxID=1977088 RepID=UPI001FCAD2F9|nr:recombinase family protein [Streptomyces ficellus]
MANLVYKRVSTDQQSTARQDLVLAEAGIEDPVVFEEDPGTSSRLHPLQRPKFRELLTYARPGDTAHISEMFRLVRGTGHILDVLEVLHRDQLALRIHDGAFSAMDLTARHPSTGELLSTVKFMVQTLAAAGELQRDLQRELTYDGLRAAEAKGSKGGRRPAVAACPRSTSTCVPSNAGFPGIWPASPTPSTSRRSSCSRPGVSFLGCGPAPSEATSHPASDGSPPSRSSTRPHFCNGSASAAAPSRPAARSTSTPGGPGTPSTAEPACEPSSAGRCRAAAADAPSPSPR